MDGGDCRAIELGLRLKYCVELYSCKYYCTSYLVYFRNVSIDAWTRSIRKILLNLFIASGQTKLDDCPNLLRHLL